MTAANSARSVDLQASRALQVDLPEPGTWKVRLEGQGVFVLSVRAQTPLRLVEVDFLGEAGVKSEPRLGLAQTAIASVAGEIGNVKFEVLGPNGAVLSRVEAPEAADRAYRFPVTPPAQRFRIRLTGIDASGWPVERTHPILFRARARN
jgi:hypothetical protein